ncbi:MAG: hypothetical protein DMG71_12650 [Acidobacteria bacterium]|nr:MAG: hypothetical protein DMG71_12650 [Acidobacteriota bacterium]
MKPEIVWRNPDPRWHKQRWQTLERRLDRNVYMVQELITKDAQGKWASAFALEVLHGGRAPLLNYVGGIPISVSQ